MNLLKTVKKNLNNNLVVKKITDNKLFWKTLKPNVTDKTLKDERITLVEDGKIISEESKFAKLFSNYFGSTAEGLDLERPEISQKYNNPVENAIRTFENHPSIVQIKSNTSPTQKFSFIF